MDGQNASNAILAQGSQLRAAYFDPPTRASGLRWLPAVSGGAGSLRSWSTCVRRAVIRVFVCSCSRGTGLSNSQAAGCALVKGLPSQARVWGSQPLEPLPAAVAAVSPRGRAGSALPCSRQAEIAGGVSWDGGAPAHHRCVAVAHCVPPWRRGIVLGCFDAEEGRARPCHQPGAPPRQARRFGGSKAELDGEFLFLGGAKLRVNQLSLSRGEF